MILLMQETKGGLSEKALGRMTEVELRDWVNDLTSHSQRRKKVYDALLAKAEKRKGAK